MPALHEPRRPRAVPALTAAMGGGLAIACVICVSRTILALEDARLLIASMGASAVLLFALPTGPLSGPWAVAGSHSISALIGVCCGRYLAPTEVAAGLAVGLAIGAMIQLRCVHPPGGATALAAVAGGEEVGELGYWFVLTPVLLNVGVILGVALLFHWPAKRYPARLGLHNPARLIKKRAR